MDALCRRFNINLSARTKHGALLDAQLLAEIYLCLNGGRQPDLELSSKSDEENIVTIQKKVRPARMFTFREEDLQKHEEFLTILKDLLWKKCG